MVNQFRYYLYLGGGGMRCGYVNFSSAPIILLDLGTGLDECTIFHVGYSQFGSNCKNSLVGTQC